MHILMAQLNPIVGDIEGNTQKIIQAIEKGKADHADLVLFSEMALTGYPAEDLLLFSHFIDAVELALEKIAISTQGITAIVGCVRRNSASAEKSFFNSAAIFENGELKGYQDKILLPTYDIFDERRFFEPGHELQLWNLGGKKVGLTICEDIWGHSSLLQYTSYRRDPVKELAALHPDVVLNLSASPYSTSHWAKRLNACKLAAQTLQCPLLLCNQVGGNDSIIFDGHSLAVDKEGRLCSKAKGFETALTIVNTEALSPQVHHDDAMQELYQALVLGIRDYFHKSGFKKACLGLSGGIDSALVACLATEALGKENVLGVLMPSRYSSSGSITDALQLVDKLHIKHRQIPIEDPFQSLLTLLEPQFEGLPQDITEENLQSRIRGLILMALSNKLGYIVLSTGNKSEIAMGYATLYGDMCGGLAVISDLTKRQVYSLAKWINRNEEIIPSNSISKEPSAELRPNQKDSDSLPHYDIIDNVLQAYVEEHQTPTLIAKRFDYSQQLVDDLIRKIHYNEYKRRQSAPGLRITEKAFSVGRRFPIVQRFVK